MYLGLIELVQMTEHVLGLSELVQMTQHVLWSY